MKLPIKIFKCTLCSFTNTKKDDIKVHLLMYHNASLYLVDSFISSVVIEVNQPKLL